MAWGGRAGCQWRLPCPPCPPCLPALPTAAPLTVSGTAPLVAHCPPPHCQLHCLPGGTLGHRGGQFFTYTCCSECQVSCLPPGYCKWGLLPLKVSGKDEWQEEGVRSRARGRGRCRSRGRGRSRSRGRSRARGRSRGRGRHRSLPLPAKTSTHQ